MRNIPQEALLMQIGSAFLLQTCLANSSGLLMHKQARIKEKSEQPAIVLFDGVCNLCNASVNFILDRDKQGVFRFAALQSDVGKKLIASCTDDSFPDSVVLFENHQIYTESTAILRICRRLGFPWQLLYFLIFIPAFLRDPVYRWIARHRYRWFGKRDVCLVPTPELHDRFL